MKYEVFIKSPWSGADIEADSAEAAKQRFIEQLTDNLGAEHIEANNLDTDDGRDPILPIPTTNEESTR
jgi:hypothetical protein